MFNKTTTTNHYNVTSGHSMQNELELHLHEQFAINNNTYLTSLLSFFASMMAVLGSYGYVFIYSDFNIADSLYCSGKGFSIASLCFALICSISMLHIIRHICINIGFKQRKEQFVIHAIRCLHYDEEHKKAYLNKFHPFDKDKNGDNNIIPGIYKDLKMICTTVQYILGGLFICKLLDYLFSVGISELYSSICKDFIWYLAVIIAFLVSECMCCHQMDEVSKDYKDLMEDYKEFNLDDSKFQKHTD